MHAPQHACPTSCMPHIMPHITSTWSALHALELYSEQACPAVCLVPVALLQRPQQHSTCHAPPQWFSAMHAVTSAVALHAVLDVNQNSECGSKQPPVVPGIIALYTHLAHFIWLAICLHLHLHYLKRRPAAGLTLSVSHASISAT